MKYTYKVRIDKIVDEENQVHTVCGVDAICGDTQLVSIPDVFYEKSNADQFVFLCNALDLKIVHLTDVIEDALV